MTAVLGSLWLPIVLSAVFVFLASSILHMAVPWHRSDTSTMPNEDRAMDALRPLGIPPGDYMVPRPQNMEEMRSAAFTEKRQKGPVMIVTVLPNGQTGMGRSLALWFVYLLIVAALTAVVASLELRRGQDFYDVAHVTLVTSFMGYCLSLWQLTIWYSRRALTTVKWTIDGLIYGAITAATFASLWPR